MVEKTQKQQARAALFAAYQNLIDAKQALAECHKTATTAAEKMELFRNEQYVISVQTIVFQLQAGL